MGPGPNRLNIYTVRRAALGMAAWLKGTDLPQRCAIAYGTRMTPARAIGSWSRSQGHRENMLEPRFREVGLASWHDGQGNVYWIQIFLTR